MISGHEHLVQRSKVSLPWTPPIYAYWTWDEGRSTFVVYNINAIVDIELAYQQYVTNNSVSTVDLSVCTSSLPYTIDFSTMIQTRHHYMTQRQIRREPIPNGYSLQDLLGFKPQSSATHTTTVDTSCFTHGPGTYMLRSGASNQVSSSASVVGPSSGVSVTSSTTVSSTGIPSSSSTKVTGKRSSRRKKASPPLGRAAKSDTGGIYYTSMN